MSWQQSREIVDPEFLVRTALNKLFQTLGFICARHCGQGGHAQLGETLGRLVQEELRCSSGSSGQQHISEGDEDISLWTKGKKKTGKGAR
jgi:hypothetical protein